MPLNIDHIRANATHLPPTMSRPLLRAVENYEDADYRSSLINLLDFFEMGVQWLICYFLAFIAESESKPKQALRAVEMIDSKRPLSFGDSVNELFNPLVEAMREVAPNHPLVVSLTENVKMRKRNILTGSQKEVGVIKIRNDYKGHSTLRSQEIYCDVIDSIAPAVDKMLAGLAPIADAEIYAIKADGSRFYLTGKKQTEASSDHPSHYYVGFDLFTPIDLYPLIMLREDKYIYVFQTLKYEAAKFESSDENVHGLETEDLNAAIDDKLQRIDSSFDISRELNWKELNQCMVNHSAEFMKEVQKEKKYSSELFVDRENLTRMLADFTESASTLLPMSGEAGQGKTNQMCHWVETFLATDTPALIFSCSAMSEMNLADTLRTIFDANPRKPLKKLLDHLHAKAADADRPVYFLFDAVNECLSYDSGESDGGSAPRRLFEDIVDFLVRPEYPKFKVVTTCRSFTWKNEITPGLSLPAGLAYQPDGADSADVVGFNDKETQTAYVKYRDFYQMATDFEQLDRRIAIQLRDPLIMKFTCSNYIGMPLPDGTDRYVSLRLFEKMLSDIDERSFAGHRQMELLIELADIIMKSYEAGKPMSSVSNADLREALADASNPLHALAGHIYMRDGVTAAYAELRNKPDRPILREVEKTIDGRRVRIVEFIYERFLEFMMAVSLKQRLAAEQKQLNAATIVAIFENAAVNVVFVGAMRNVVIMELMRHPDSTLLLDLVGGYNDNEYIMQLINEIMDVLVRENIESELFGLIQAMLDHRPDEPGVIEEFNAKQRDIASNKATHETIVRYNELTQTLMPVIRLRNAANMVINNLLLTDLFNEDLYEVNPLTMLWQIVMDDIDEVGNEACKFIYYLSRHQETSSHTPLRENLTRRIVREMYSDLMSRTVMANVSRARARRKTMTFIESATRLATLMIIDATIAEQQDKDTVTDMLGQIRNIASYFTWKFRLIKLFMPFLQSVMRKQVTFQSTYVNNIIEYQGFWDDTVVPPKAEVSGWSRVRVAEAMDFVGFYGRHHGDRASDAYRIENERFKAFIPVIRSAYDSGCSFTNLIMERLLIIVGTDNWPTVRNLYMDLLGEVGHDAEWFDYTQMSLIYSLFQLEVNSSSHNPELLALLTRQVDEWTHRCRGLFKARHSHKANRMGLYKRNVVNWYCVAYSTHIGENVAHDGDARPVPLLYDLIDEAVANRDKELMMHLLENLAETVSDFGYVETTLAAIKYILGHYHTRQDLAEIDNVECPHDRFANETLISKVGSVLSTAKTYFPQQTDAFIRSDIAGMDFPGVESYREEILSYHQRGETLSDVFTHKFGNFLLWSLMHEEVVDRFAYEAITAAVDKRDCFAWFDNVIRILFKDMFNIQL